MRTPTREQRDAFEQLCLLRALYAHRGPLDRACPAPGAALHPPLVTIDHRAAIAEVELMTSLEGRQVAS